MFGKVYNSRQEQPLLSGSHDSLLCPRRNLKAYFKQGKPVVNRGFATSNTSGFSRTSKIRHKEQVIEILNNTRDCFVRSNGER